MVSLQETVVNKIIKGFRVLEKTFALYLVGNEIFKRNIFHFGELYDAISVREDFVRI